MAKILEFPNTDNLSESVKILRKELLDTVYKYDEILVHESYQLKIEYIRTFGSIEYKYLSKKLVYNKLKEKELKSTMILQVHDELILNVKENELEEVKQIVKDEMEKVLDMKVPLEVDTNMGKTWYEAK